jgi:hypothetical protein
MYIFAWPKVKVHYGGATEPTQSVLFLGTPGYKFQLVVGLICQLRLSRNFSGILCSVWSYILQISDGISPTPSCANIQIVALHDYNVDPSYVASHIDAVKGIAGSSGKRLLYEEFGALGSNKQSQIKAVTDTLISVSRFFFGALETDKTFRRAYRGCIGRYTYPPYIFLTVLKVCNAGYEARQGFQ